MKQSPYFNINYGWPYGSDGWNAGMDENLLVLSFLNSHQVISIVPSTPEGVQEGDAYIISSDNSARFFADGAWYIVYPSDGWEFSTTEDGLLWIYENGLPVQKVSPDNLADTVDVLFQRVDGVTTDIESLTVSVDSLSDVPGRLESLEENSATSSELSGVSDRVGVLEDSAILVDGRLDSLSFDVGEMQTEMLDINTEMDAKVSSILPGDGINVDNTDPINPVVSLDTSFLGTAALADTGDFDPSGAAGAVETSLTSLINERMSATARSAIDALDPDTATLSDLITALQS